MKRNNNLWNLWNRRISYLNRCYDIGKPIITDSMYDALLSYLRNNMCCSVLWNNRQSVNYTQSLYMDMQSVEVVDHLPQLPLWPYKSLKIDGIALEVVYKKGRLCYIATRGNANKGKSVLRYLDSIDIFHLPKIVPYDSLLVVRGEVGLPWKDFFENYPEGLHPRNIVAGLFSRKSSVSLFKPTLHFWTYQALSPRILERNSADVFLSKLGFKPVPKLKSQHTDVFTNSQLYRWWKRMSRLLPSDGLVLKTNNNLDYNTCNRGFHQGCIAYKFTSLSQWSTVRRISWNISRFGRFVIVIHIDPIRLQGSKISQATGNSWGWCQSNMLNIGSLVEVVRSGSIIPKIINVIPSKESVNLHLCPFCHSYPKIVGRHLYCPKYSCMGRFKSLVAYSLGWMNCRFWNRSKLAMIDQHSIQGWRIFLQHIKSTNMSLFIEIWQKVKRLTGSHVLILYGVPGVTLETTSAFPDYRDLLEYLQKGKRKVYEGLVKHNRRIFRLYHLLFNKKFRMIL